MKLSSPMLSAATAVLLAAAFAVTTFAQAPAPPQPPAGSPPPPPHSFPAPTNLKVLPKDLTAEQVHDIMHKWEAALGTNCSHCHAADPNKIGPDGRPRLNFADDSKPEKATARLMYGMVENINTNYIGKIDNSGMPVTCGTCHRGHTDPEPFVAPPDNDHDHGHNGPPPTGEKPPLPR